MADLITYTLPGFPLIDQRHEPTVDGYPDENADWNCVPASLAAGLRCLTGKQFDGDELKDAVYGQGYRGAQAARTYIAYCARQGVTLAPFDSSDSAALVARIHAELQHGHPVILTMPSQWGIPQADPLHPTGSTHVGTACGYGPAALRVMNPWGGFWHDGTDDYWRARLCYGEVWVMRLTNEGVTHVAWTRITGGANDSKGHHVGQGLADAIFASNKQGIDGLAGETYVPGAKHPGVQPFESYVPLADGTLKVWKGNHADEDGASVTVELQARGDAANATITSLTQQRDAASQHASDLTTQLTAANAENADLKAQLAKEHQPTAKETAAIALGQAIDAYEAAK